MKSDTVNHDKSSDLARVGEPEAGRLGGCIVHRQWRSSLEVDVEFSIIAAPPASLTAVTLFEWPMSLNQVNPAHLD